jgi:pSer/pThr/pTyr-binding forkhead associated (FHA) protein
VPCTALQNVSGADCRHRYGTPYSGAGVRNASSADAVYSGRPGQLSVTIQEALKALDLSASSSQAEIKQAYRDQVKVWHPDRFPNDPRLRDKAQEELKKINEAYRVLKGYRPPAHHRGSSEGGAPPQTPRQADRSPASQSPSPGASAPPPPAPEPGFSSRAHYDRTTKSKIPDGLEALFIHAGQGRSFPIKHPTAFIGRYDPARGRRPDIDLTQVDSTRSVSRRHARIIFDGDQFQLSEEAGTRNGTFINGRRLTPGNWARLQGGDSVAFGSVSLEFKIEERAQRARRSSESSQPAPQPDTWERVRSAYEHFITRSVRPGFIGALAVAVAAVMLGAYLRGASSDAGAIPETVTPVDAALSTQPVPATTPIPGLLFPEIPPVADVPIQCQIRYRCDVALRAYAIDLKACTTSLERPHPANLLYSCAKTTASMGKVAAFCEAAVGRYSQAEMSICVPSSKRRRP